MTRHSLPNAAARQFPEGFLLSVIVPVYNEAETVAEIIQQIVATGVPCEIIAVNDGSTDTTHGVLASLVETYPQLRLITHSRNLGKGAAVRAGCACMQGSCVLVQDADLEYDPRDYLALLNPILEDRADVVYGSRFLTSDNQFSTTWHRWGNACITWASNCATRLKLSDVETCYKVFRRDVLDAILPELTENGFGVELQITAVLARRGFRIAEIPIRYQGRGYADGKKIGVGDAVRAFWCILRN